jgi:uncharacterized protein YeeX (DUF496 family)
MDKDLWMNAYKKDFENALEMIEWQNTMLRQQAEKIEALKQIIDANNLSQNIGQFIKPDLKIEEVMSEHCTYYKLGYSALNNYTKVKDELLTKGEVK